MQFTKIEKSSLPEICPDIEKSTVNIYYICLGDIFDIRGLAVTIIHPEIDERMYIS